MAPGSDFAPAMPGKANMWVRPYPTAGWDPRMHTPWPLPGPLLRFSPKESRMALEIGLELARRNTGWMHLSRS